MVTRSYGRNMFSFIGNYQTVFQSSVLFCISPSIEWIFLAPHPCFYIFSVLKFGHSKRCAVTSHCFKLCLPCDIWYGASFCMLICPLCDSFVEIPVGWFFKSICSLYYYWVLIDLYIFGQQLFIRCDFCKYFLLVCGLSSNFLDIVFHTAQIFNLNEVQLLLSWLMPLTLYLKSHHHIPSHLGFREPVKLST